ncbi:hypothetical protein FKM82_029182 [Ascaphus truei]
MPHLVLDLTFRVTMLYSWIFNTHKEDTSIGSVCYIKQAKCSAINQLEMKGKPRSEWESGRRHIWHFYYCF